MSFMNIKFRLLVMNFLEFFVWGAWLISLGAYTTNTLHFSAVQTASIYGTMGVAALFMPALLGMVADRWLHAERLFGSCHFAGAGLLLWASSLTDYGTLYFVMLLNSMLFVPTIALNNTVSYIVLQERKYDIVKDFPPVRVWGTIGFIAARSHSNLAAMDWIGTPAAAARMIRACWIWNQANRRPRATACRRDMPTRPCRGTRLLSAPTSCPASGKVASTRSRGSAAIMHLMISRIHPLSNCLNVNQETAQ